MPITAEEEALHQTPESYLGTWWYFAGPDHGQVLQVTQVTTRGDDTPEGSVVQPILCFKPVEWSRTTYPLPSEGVDFSCMVPLYQLRNRFHGLTYLGNGGWIMVFVRIGQEVIDLDRVNRAVITIIDLPFVTLQTAVDDGPVEDGRIMMLNLYELMNEWTPFLPEESDYQPSPIQILDSDEYVSDMVTVEIPGYALPRTRYERVEE